MIVLAVLLGASAAAAAPAHPWTDAPASPSRPTAPPQSIATLVKTSMPAVVGIVAVTARMGSSDPFHDFLERMYGNGGPEHEQPVRGIGTGFFIRSDGLVVTNWHVVEGATDVAVQVGEDERPYRGVLVGKDDATDLALVRVEGGGPFPVITLGDSEGVEVGEWVVAIGNPFGLSRSVTTGIISYKGRRDVNPAGKPGYYDFLQTDAAINPGNSGGPLLDARGAVIGINAAVNPSGQGIGFAIPINMLKEILPQLEKGRVVRSWMGITVQDQLGPDLAESFAVPNGKGVLVTDVVEGGPAERSGVKAGDVVVSFEGEPLTEAYRLRWLAANAGPGRTVKMGVWRAGHLRDVRVALVPKPGEPPESKAPLPLVRKDLEPFGLGVEDLDPASAADRNGVRVTAVDLRGDAYRVGLREGDLLLEVDGRPVHDRLEFRRVVSENRTPVVRLYVRRGSRAIFFGLRRGAQQTARAETPVLELEPKVVKGR
ncbi:MAG: trypsin-like peptidase domain-containing protein [Myxococcales bacterium]